jgi:hypothetical protein
MEMCFGEAPVEFKETQALFYWACLCTQMVAALWRCRIVQCLVSLSHMLKDTVQSSTSIMLPPFVYKHKCGQMQDCLSTLLSPFVCRTWHVSATNHRSDDFSLSTLLPPFMQVPKNFQQTMSWLQALTPISPGLLDYNKIRKTAL